MSLYEKKGYLNEDFQLFHLIDQSVKEFELHYHEFDKILLFLKGDVSYQIEGKSYDLKPYDIVLVNHGELHRPIIQSNQPYERIIIYISSKFMNDYKTDSYNLLNCFEKAKSEHANVLRLFSMEHSKLYLATKDLESSFQDNSYAASLRKNILFLEFMIQLNRSVLTNSLEYIETCSKNPKIQDMIDYINLHLTSQDLTIDTLSSLFFMSKYHMMRQFKQDTGYTINNYILQKRLQLAKELLKTAVPLTQLCYDCGFKDYSTFSRAYKKQFHESPRKTRQNLKLSNESKE